MTTSQSMRAYIYYRWYGMMRSGMVSYVGNAYSVYLECAANRGWEKGGARS